MEQNQPQKAKRDWLKIVFQASVGLIAAVMIIVIGTVIFSLSAPPSDADAERWEEIVQQKMRELRELDGAAK